MSRKHRNETQLLQRIKAYFNSDELAHAASLVRGIGDDAALLAEKSQHQTVLTCDWFLEGTHFLRAKHPPDAVGWKCLARAVSDLAAMGGKPRCFLLSLALPDNLTGEWLDKFLRGLRRAARKFECVLAGGDTTRSNKILISVTAIGDLSASGAVLRSGAQAGDIIYVSGRLGEAERGLKLLRAGKSSANLRDHRLKKHLYPEPRLALGRWLASNKIGTTVMELSDRLSSDLPRLALGRWLASKKIATAMMDISDGLSSDLPRLCTASEVGARIVSASVPAVKLSRAEEKVGMDALKLALHGGDDYELLFTVSAKAAENMPRSFEGIPLSAIGEITQKRNVLLLDEKGHERPLPAGGWDPFR